MPGQVVGYRPLIVEAQFRFQARPCGISGGQSGNGTGLSPSTSGFPFLHHSLVSTCCFYQSGKLAKPGNPTKKAVLFGNRVA
jgi:hypothetical protein